MPETPRRLSATTRKPETAPPRRETVIASARERVAAADGDVHADVAGEGGGGGAHDEGDGGEEALLPAADHLVAVLDLAVIADDLLHALGDAAHDEEDGDGGDDGEHRDGAVLTPEEGHGALEDH
jgi:hypothetical protein